jgi:hypothetical protein
MMAAGHMISSRSTAGTLCREQATYQKDNTG